jgi:hypothetical protein
MSDLGKRPLRLVRPHDQRAFEAKTLDEFVDRLAHQQLEHAMEVKRGKVRDLSELLERQGVVQMLDHIVDHAVHPLHVVECGPVGAVAGASQDMSSSPWRAAVL